jgi:flagellar biosynthetic protein FliQ
MAPTEVIDLVREAIWVLIKVGGPPMLVGLFVGVAISLVQALTQVQEMTLTFIPKILAIFLSIVVFAPFMYSSMSGLMDTVAARISGLE